MSSSAWTPVADTSAWKPIEGAPISGGKTEGESLPPNEWLDRHYGRQGDTSIEQAKDRYRKRGFLDKTLDFISKPAEFFTDKTINAIDAAKSGQYAKAGNEGFKAAAVLAAPALPQALAAAPVATTVGLGTGIIGGKAIQGVAGSMGATPDQAELAGNIGGLVTGMAGSQAPKALPFLAKTAGKVANIVDPDLVGLVSPRAAHGLKWLSKAADVISKTGTKDSGGLSDIIDNHAGKISELQTQLKEALAKVNPEGPSAKITDVPDLRVQPSQQAPQNLLNKPSAPAVVPRPQGGTFQVNPPEGAVTPSGKVTPDMEIYKEPDVVPKIPAKKLSLVEQLREWDNIRKIHSQLEDQIGKGQDEIQQWMEQHNQQAPGGKNPAQAAFDKAKQGGHAGGGAISEEEAARPGANYVVSKSGNVTAHGKQFAPESIPPGSTHVSVLPDGSFRVNAGQKLTALQESALQSAIKKPVFSGTPKVPTSESEMESILTEMMRQMKSNKARSAKAGD